ncbi:hypothetical protein ACLOJK_021409 [Asimina triloba]
MTDISIGQHIILGVADEQSHVEIEMSATTMADAKVVQKNALKVGLLSSTVSAIWAVGNIPGTLTNACSEQKTSHGQYQYLIAIAYALVSFMSFGTGILLVLFSILLPKVPRIMSLAKKLLWVAFLLVHMALGLKMITHVAIGC